MFLHFHKLTTELFHSIKTQQISLFNASVGLLLIVCATFSEQLKALVCKVQHCQTEDCVLQVSGSFDWNTLRKQKRILYLLCCSLKFVKLFAYKEVTYWLLWQLLWCCATCLSLGPVVWPVWSSHRPRWCWTASPGLCDDQWSTCKCNTCNM